MQRKEWIVIISILIIILLFCIFIFIQQGIEYKDKMTICISFSALFATFGGAYFGAKISGKYTLKSIEEQQKNEQDKIDEIVRYNVTLAIIKIEDNIEEIYHKLEVHIDNSDEKNLDSVQKICDGFILPIKNFIEDENVGKARINMNIALSEYIRVGNRLANYGMHSYDYDHPEFDDEIIRNSLRDFYLTKEEIEIRDSNNSIHYYIAECLMVYKTLYKNLEILKDKVLDKNIYDSIPKIDSDI